jgi:hypothetical protein
MLRAILGPSHIGRAETRRPPGYHCLASSTQSIAGLHWLRSPVRGIGPLRSYDSDFRTGTDPRR